MIEGDPRTAIGDMRWTNYRVSVDVKFEDYAGRAPYVLLGAREMGGDKFTTDICGYDVKLRADGLWLLRRYGDEKDAAISRTLGNPHCVQANRYFLVKVDNGSRCLLKYREHASACGSTGPW